MSQLKACPPGECQFGACENTSYSDYGCGSCCSCQGVCARVYVACICPEVSIGDSAQQYPIPHPLCKVHGKDTI
jgi:hypothetical protein